MFSHCIPLYWLTAPVGEAAVGLGLLVRQVRLHCQGEVRLLDSDGEGARERAGRVGTSFREASL